MDQGPTPYSITPETKTPIANEQQTPTILVSSEPSVSMAPTQAGQERTRTLAMAAALSTAASPAVKHAPEETATLDMTKSEKPTSAKQEPSSSTTTQMGQPSETKAEPTILASRSP